MPSQEVHNFVAKRYISKEEFEDVSRMANRVNDFERQKQTARDHKRKTREFLTLVEKLRNVADEDLGKNLVSYTESVSNSLADLSESFSRFYQENKTWIKRNAGKTSTELTRFETTVKDLEPYPSVFRAVRNITAHQSTIDIKFELPDNRTQGFELLYKLETSKLVECNCRNTNLIQNLDCLDEHIELYEFIENWEQLFRQLFFVAMDIKSCAYLSDASSLKIVLDSIDVPDAAVPVYFCQQDETLPSEELSRLEINYGIFQRKIINEILQKT